MGKNSLAQHHHDNQPLAWMSGLTPAIHESGYGLNLLVDHAGRVFEWLASASKQEEKKDTATLYAQAQALLQSVRDNYTTLAYAKDVIISAHFCLCATIDEIVFHPHQLESDNYSLLASFHREKNGGEKFFYLLDHVVRAPKQYHDLIELMYFCMMLGFKGHYQHSMFSIHQHRQLCSDLYRLIKQHKGDISSILSPRLLTATKQRKKTNASTRFSRYIKTCSTTLFILAVLSLAVEFAFIHITDSLLLSEETSRYETVRH